jgi:hypothetical protein
VAFPTLHQDNARFRRATAAVGSSYSAAVLADSPVGYWRLGEGSGITAADASGNGRNGTYTNGVTLGSAGALAGDTDTAATFDGSDDYVALPLDAAFNITGDLTIEAWILPASISASAATGHIFGGYQNGGSFPGYALAIGNTVPFQALSFWDGTAWRAATTLLTANTWYHVAVSVSGTTATFYVNGALDSAPACAARGSWSGGRAIGARSDGSGGATTNWPGRLDEVAIYNTALSAARILAHYNAGI